MDKIRDRKTLEVGGHWPLWRGWKKRMTTQNRQKSNVEKREKNVKINRRSRPFEVQISLNNSCPYEQCVQFEQNTCMSMTAGNEVCICCCLLDCICSSSY